MPLVVHIKSAMGASIGAPVPSAICMLQQDLRVSPRIRGLKDPDRVLIDSLVQDAASQPPVLMARNLENTSLRRTGKFDGMSVEHG